MLSVGDRVYIETQRAEGVYRVVRVREEDVWIWPEGGSAVDVRPINGSFVCSLEEDE